MQAAEKYAEKFNFFQKVDAYFDFIAGAKWQEERSYTYEEARAIWYAGQEYWKTSGDSITFEELIEKFNQKKGITNKDD